MYKVITSPTPNNKDRGTFLFGLRTSPAVNVMLFQASAANSDPIGAAHNAINIPNPVSREMPGAGGVYPRGVQADPKFDLTVINFHPTAPNTMTPSREPSFADVKTFWTILPYFTPFVLVQVSSATKQRAISWVVESEIA